MSTVLSIKGIGRGLAGWLTLSLLANSSGCATIPASVMGTVEHRVLYQPTHDLDYSRVPPDLPLEEVLIQSPDNPKLHAWYCPAKNPRAVVLFAHGNAGNIADRAELIHTWNKQLGVTVLAFDYRGYGRSEGEPTEAGLVDDARVARDWLAERVGLSKHNIVLYGRSLGGAVVAELAASDGARGLILESTFTSIPDVANWKLPHTRVGDQLETEFNSLARIADYHGPVLIAHGERDMTVPFHHGRALFAAANQPKRFFTVKGARHNWTPTHEYLLNVSAFIESLPSSTTDNAISQRSEAASQR